jgi:hypothetical protein
MSTDSASREPKQISLCASEPSNTSKTFAAPSSGGYGFGSTEPVKNYWSPYDGPLIPSKPRFVFASPPQLQPSQSTHMHCAWFPHDAYYANYERRFLSFKTWPKQLKQQPDELSAAGFYYEGVGDHVYCFFCGKNLYNWESKDNSFLEHKRWSPQCKYLKMVFSG